MGAMPSNVCLRRGLVWFGRGVIVAVGGEEARGGAGGEEARGAVGGEEARGAAGGEEGRGGVEAGFAATGAGSTGGAVVEGSPPQSVSIESVDGGIEGNGVRMPGGRLEAGLGGTDDVRAAFGALARSSSSLLTRAFCSHTAPFGQASHARQDATVRVTRGTFSRERN